MNDTYNEPITLLKSIGDALNSMDHPQAGALLDLFDQKFNGTSLHRDIIYNRLILEAELAMRTGVVGNSIDHLIRMLKIFDSTPELKVKLLLRAGQLECISNRLGISPQYFSQALGLSEEIGDLKLIAEVYQSISRMFSQRYPGLSLYFIRKAELKYKDCGKMKEAFICRMQRALLYTFCLRAGRIDPNRSQRFYNEAMDIVGKELDDNLNQFEKKHCRYIKAYFERNEEELYTLIKELDGINALPDKCRYMDAYVGMCVEKGLWEKATEMFVAYKDSCRQLHAGEPDIESNLSEMEHIIRNRIPANFIPHHLLKREDEPITLFDILDHYSLEDEAFALDKSILRSLLPSYEQEGYFEAIQMPDGDTRLYPMGLAFNVYYRGQSKYYEKSYPSLYRKGVTDSEVFVERMRYEELKRCIADYPITVYFKNGISIKAPDGTEIPISLSVDALALAQHYGIKTELMDITTDKFVAAFFASTICKDNIYYPITTPQDKKGVFYRYWEIKPENEKLSAVGLQPFSRPGEQCGLVLKMTKGEDFNDIVGSKDFFTHDPSVSEFLFNYTNRSKKLFPESQLTEHAEKIVKANKLSVWAFNEAKKEFYPDTPEELLHQYLREQNIELDDEVTFAFSEEEIKQCQTDWENGNKENTLQRIYSRFVYNAPI